MRGLRPRIFLFLYLDFLNLTPLAVNMNSMAEQIDVLIKSNIEEQKNFFSDFTS